MPEDIRAFQREVATVAQRELSVPVSFDVDADDKKVAIEFGHRGHDGRPVFLSLDRESAGTRRLLVVLDFVFRALDDSVPICVDELDSSLHTHASEAVLALFCSRDTNPKGAQLIATTHDSELMRSGVRAAVRSSTWKSIAAWEFPTPLRRRQSSARAGEDARQVRTCRSSPRAITNTATDALARRIQLSAFGKKSCCPSIWWEAMAACPSSDRIQSTKRWPELGLDVGMLLGIHQGYSVLVEEPRIALDRDQIVALVGEGYPGGAVGHDVGAHARADIERRAHARPGLAVPAAPKPPVRRPRSPSTARLPPCAFRCHRRARRMAPRPRRWSSGRRSRRSCPRRPQESEGGPTMTKSLYMTFARATP